MDNTNRDMKEVQTDQNAKPQSLKGIPFDWSYFQNEEWDYEDCPNHEEFMSSDQRQKVRETWQAAEDKVIFKLLRLDYDTCDCEPPCSCGRWVHDITFFTSATESIDGIEVETETYLKDEEMVRLYFNDKSASIPLWKSTLYDFWLACQYLGIPLHFREQYQYLDPHQ